MGAAAYARGSRVISLQADNDVEAGGSIDRNERQAHKVERERLLAQVRDLELKLRRSERAREGLRLTLTEERRARAEEREQADSSYRFAVRTLAKRAGLDGSDSEGTAK